MKTAKTTLAAITLVATTILPVADAHGPVVDAADPAHVVYGASEKARDQITDAAAAFSAAGLRLPRLEIHVHASYAGCNGFSGWFNGDGSGSRIDWCSGHSFTLLHEFAHAWEYHQVDDAVRDAFLELHGLESWRSREVPWADRGVEVAAETIAKGLLERELPTWQCDDAVLLDEGFALLTGRRSPRFVDARDRC